MARNIRFDRQSFRFVETVQKLSDEVFWNPDAKVMGLSEYRKIENIEIPLTFEALLDHLRIKASADLIILSVFSIVLSLALAISFKVEGDRLSIIPAFFAGVSSGALAMFLGLRDRGRN